MFFLNKNRYEFTYTTTNATSTNITSIPVDPSKAFLVEIETVAKDQGSTDCMWLDQSGLFKTDGSGTLTGVITGLVDTVLDQRTVGALLGTWAVQVSIVSDHVNINLKGAANKTIDWIVGVTIFQFP